MSEPICKGSGKVLVEVVAGGGGVCLVVGGDNSGTRVAGPKPWGGGRTVHRFKCDAADLLNAVHPYVAASETVK